MTRVEDLLTQAGAVRARLANPRELRSADEAARVAGEFIALEHQIRWLPGAAVQLRRHIVTPLIPGTPNHAFMAGLVLARWSPDGTAATLLDAARLDDVWCARMARLNLRWLAPTRENGRTLAEALAERTATDPVPWHVVAEALAHQRDVALMPPIVGYLTGTDAQANRAWVLISLVALMPEPGLDVAATLAAAPAGALPVTATGLRAAYGHHDAFERTQRICRERGPDWHTALYWLGRIPHPEAMALQIDGLQHPDPAVRADLVSSLVLVGSPAALRAAADALMDPDPAVVDTATSHMAQFIGPAFDEMNWMWDKDGRLDNASRARLRAEADRRIAALDDGRRYLLGQPIEPHGLIDLLYIGFQPSHTWVNFIATTGAVAGYSPHMDALGNLESLHRLEEWHAAHASAFIPGAWYWFGARVRARAPHRG